MPDDTVERLTQVIAVQRYFLTAGGIAYAAAFSGADEKLLSESSVSGILEDFRNAARSLLETADISGPDFSLERCELQVRQNKEKYEELKSMLLSTGVKAEVGVDVLADTLAQISRIRRVGERMVKGVGVLQSLRSMVVPQKAEVTDVNGMQHAERRSP